MRYLDLASLENLNSYLSGIDVGDCVLNGRVEAYTSTKYRCLCVFRCLYGAH